MKPDAVLPWHTPERFERPPRIRYLPTVSVSPRAKPPFERDTNEQLLQDEPELWNREQFPCVRRRDPVGPLEGTVVHREPHLSGRPVGGLLRRTRYRGVWVHTVGGGGGLGTDYPTCPGTIRTLTRDVLDSFHLVETAR